MNTPEELVRALARCNELTFPCDLLAADGPRGLDRRTSALVRLSALLAADAGTASLRWAVEAAMATGLEDRALIGVLVSAAPAAGAAQTVASASRLALAMDIDLEVDGWDGS